MGKWRNLFRRLIRHRESRVFRYNAFDAIATAQSGAFIIPGLGGAAGYGIEGYSTIKIADGAYLMPGGFTGFDIWNGTHIKMGRNARITMPYQYSGHVFRIANGKVRKH